MRNLVIVATAVLGFAGGVALASPELAKSSGCTTCHDVIHTRQSEPSFTQ